MTPMKNEELESSRPPREKMDQPDRRAEELLALRERLVKMSEASPACPRESIQNRCRILDKAGDETCQRGNIRPRKFSTSSGGRR